MAHAALVTCSTVKAPPARATATGFRPMRATCRPVQCVAHLEKTTAPSSTCATTPPALKLAGALAAAMLALAPMTGSALADELEKLEDTVPALVEELGTIADPKEESAAAAALDAVESEVSKLDETEEASGPSAVEGAASALQETIDALKETFSLK